MMFVSINDLTFKYQNNSDLVIDNFTLEIEKGKIIAVLGKSGSGKSTLLRIISGLEIPIKGNIVINNKTMVDENTFIEPEHRGIGMVFQDYALFPHMTIEKNIEYGLYKINKEEKRKRVEEVLELVNLTGLNKRYPNQLSGGQQQRVALARALAPSPSLLLLDEPFSNLDAELKTKIRNELKLILKKAKITSIFVTHDIEDAKEISDKIIYLTNGKIG